MKNLLIITGGSKGIGKATIEQFINQGWCIINLSRSPCPIDNVKNISVDFLANDWQKNCMPTLIEACQQANQVSLVNNAACCYADSIQSIEQSQLTNALHLNAVIPAILTQLLLSHLPDNSSIIFIGSTLSEKAVSGVLSYTTSKHAVAGLMKATCQDLAERPIHTACICPGITDTEMLRARCGHDEAILNSLKNLNARQRLIKPQEIAEVIYFAANNPVINGSVIHANMGQIEK